MKRFKREKTAVESAFAKINLWLEITGRRPDGYHDIRSVMQTVSLCDTVTLRLTDGGVSMTCSDPTLSCGRDNLCLRAAEAYMAACGEECGVSLHLDKVIPREAGLGGGSADAAAVLRALDSLNAEPLGVSVLRRIGRTLGADVPFCVAGGSALAEGIGELLSEHPTLPDCHIVISGGIGHIATPEAYRRIDSIKPAGTPSFHAFRSAAEAQELTAVASQLYNRFEDAVPEAEGVKAILIGNGAAGALMTGSGAAVYGLFAAKEEAVRAAAALKENRLSAYLCRPVPGIGERDRKG